MAGSGIIMTARETTVHLLHFSPSAWSYRSPAGGCKPEQLLSSIPHQLTSLEAAFGNRHNFHQALEGGVEVRAGKRVQHHFFGEQSRQIP